MTSSWSFRAFRLAGVGVRVHWTLPAFVLYYVVRAEALGYGPLALLLFVALPMALLFASVTAHEFGHVFAARRFALPVGDVVLTPLGGMVMVAQGCTPRHERVVAVAGPLVNLGLAVAAATAYLALGGAPVKELLLGFGGANVIAGHWLRRELLLLVLFDFAQQQVTLFLFNLLCAAYPMDGGRILLSFLWARRGFHAGLATACRVSRVVAAVLGLVGLATKNPLLVMVALSVFLQAQMTSRGASQLPDPGHGYDSGFARALERQRAHLEASRKKRQKPSFLSAWWRARRADRVRELLARATAEGLGSLRPAERDFLRRARLEVPRPRG